MNFEKKTQQRTKRSLHRKFRHNYCDSPGHCWQSYVTVGLDAFFLSRERAAGR